MNKKKTLTLVLTFIIILLSAVTIIIFSGGDKVLGSKKLNFVMDNIKNGTLGKGERYEASFRFENRFINPYDPDEVELNAFFILPDQSKITIPGFWYEGFERKLAYGREQLVTNGIKAWKIRYTPKIVGKYDYYIELMDKKQGKTYRYPESGVLSFESVHTENTGFLKVSPSDPAYLEFDDGSPFIGIGHNLCGWEWGGTDNARGTYEYDEWLLNLHNSKANMAQFDFCEGDQIEWTSHEDELPFSSDWNGLTRYNQQNAWKMDYRFQKAEELGIYFRLSLFHWEDFDTEEENFPDWGWNRNPYNKLNGGPADNVTEFFRDEKSKTAVKKLLRYIVARWGYSGSIMAYELWNEVDAGDIVWGENSSYDSAEPYITEWHEEMSEYIKAIDINSHLVTSSCASTFNGNAMWSLPDMDLSTFHRYTFYNPDYSDIKFETVETLHKLITDRYRNTGKPVLVGEFALSPGGDIQKDFDHNGTAFHNQIWSSIMSKALGTAMHWTWGSYIHDYDLYYHYKPLGIFTKDEDFRELKAFNNFSDKASRIRILGLKSSDRVLAWIQDRNNDFVKLREGYVPETLINEQVVFSGLDNADYRVEFYNTYTGEIAGRTSVQCLNGSINIQLPDFKYDMALKITRTSSEAEWISKDIPAAKISSSTSLEGKSIRIRAGGTGIGGMMDDFRFVWKSRTGDFEITARLDSLTNLGEKVKTGLMIRESEHPNSRFAFLSIDPSGKASFGSRVDGIATFSAPVNFKFNGHLKLVRRNDEITALISLDNVSWQKVGSVGLPDFSSEVLVGLASASSNPVTYIDAAYGYVKIK